MPGRHYQLSTPNSQLARKAPWPKSLPDRVKAVTAMLAKSTGPTTADDIAAHFRHARRSAIAEILKTLATMGQAHRGTAEGTYLP
jgi:hypothetical protein